MFFWLSFEQGATSLVLFARDSVDRVLTGNSATIYNIVNALLTIVPLGFITWVLVLLWKRTFKKIPGSNIVLVICFAGLWGIVGWMLNRDFNTTSYEVSYSSYQGEPIMDEETKKQKVDDAGNLMFSHIPITENMLVPENAIFFTEITNVGEQKTFEVGQEISMIHTDNEKSKYGYLNEDALAKARVNGEKQGQDNGIIQAKVSRIKSNEVEITVSWFSILNSFFIIVFASIFSKWWES